MVLDGVWLRLLMTNFYREQLAPIVRLANGALRWSVTLVVHVLLGTGIAVFAIRRTSRLSSAPALEGWSSMVSTTPPLVRRAVSGCSC